RGLRDLLPDQMLARQELIDTIRLVYELYGFVPLYTPAIEYLDVLSGTAGPETQQSLFRVTNPDQEELGLRFAVPVPLALVGAEPSARLRSHSAAAIRRRLPSAGQARQSGDREGRPRVDAGLQRRIGRFHPRPRAGAGAGRPHRAVPGDQSRFAKRGAAARTR